MTAYMTHWCYSMGGHDKCPGYALRARAGVLPGITRIHHPNPDPGESLQHYHVPCVCPCHKATTNQKALPPGSTAD